ncbi:hypothetical protein CIB48_g5493 [Xylaria polymorpha]|nr:hypothetical protein CIB48_g5493 [Xylaria polymorpha]
MHYYQHGTTGKGLACIYCNTGTTTRSQHVQGLWLDQRAWNLVNRETVIGTWDKVQWCTRDNGTLRRPGKLLVEGANKVRVRAPMTSHRRLGTLCADAARHGRIPTDASQTGPRWLAFWVTNRLSPTTN